MSLNEQLWRWKQKPPLGYQLDPDWVAANNLISFWAFNENNGAAHDLINRPTYTNTTNPTWVIEQQGICVYGESTSGATSTYLNFTSNFTVLAGLYTSGQPATAFLDIIGRYTYSSETVNTGWLLQMRPATPLTTAGWSFLLFNNNAVATYGTGIYNNSLGAGNYIIGGSTDGTTKKLYLNGNLVGSSTTGPTCSSSIGNLGPQSGPSGSNVLYLYWYLVANKALTAAQMRNLSSNPWQGFLPPNTRRWFVSANTPPIGTASGNSTANGATPLNNSFHSVSNRVIVVPRNLILPPVKP